MTKLFETEEGEQEVVIISKLNVIVAIVIIAVLFTIVGGWLTAGSRDGINAQTQNKLDNCTKNLTQEMRKDVLYKETQKTKKEVENNEKVLNKRYWALGE